MPDAVGASHIHKDEEHAHDDGRDRQQLAEDCDLLDGFPVVDVGRDHQHDGRGRHPHKEGEVADVKGPGHLVTHVGGDEPLGNLLDPRCDSPQHEKAEEADPCEVPAVAAQR